MGFLFHEQNAVGDDERLCECCKGVAIGRGIGKPSLSCDSKFSDGWLSLENAFVKSGHRSGAGWMLRTVINQSLRDTSRKRVIQ